jgi:hypothetical protein
MPVEAEKNIAAIGPPISMTIPNVEKNPAAKI